MLMYPGEGQEQPPIQTEVLLISLTQLLSVQFSIIVLVGEQVTLSCQLTPGIPSNTSVLWYKEEKGRDAPLCSSSSLDGEVEQCQDEEGCRIKGRWERRRFLLIIQKVQIADRGVYICVVRGNAVSQEAVTHLDVIGKQGDCYDPVEFIPPEKPFATGKGGKSPLGPVVLGPDLLSSFVVAVVTVQRSSVPSMHLGNSLIIAVDVTLDSDTAHPRLQVSEDGKSVTDTGVIRKVPNKEERFDSHTFLLAKEGFTSGRHYWEVDVGKKRNWNLGVAQETVTRKETVALSPKNGFWVIGLADGQEYWAHSDPWTRLTVSGRPQKIGIFLDTSSKKLSFFSVHQKKLLYTFTSVNPHSQNVRLFPFFSTGSAATNSDTEPLRIVCKNRVPTEGNLTDLPSLFLFAEIPFTWKWCEIWASLSHFGIWSKKYSGEFTKY
uniref:Uncharacterized protein n=1 Tax=Pavo cristatus TaxID=9049 RepID=A0A8C9FQR4_PAVCR